MKTPLPESLFKYNIIKKDNLAHVFSCEFCEIFKNIFFTEHLRAAVSAYWLSNLEIFVLYWPK